MTSRAQGVSGGSLPRFPAPPASEQPGGSFFINLPSRAAADLGNNFLGLEFRLRPRDQKLENWSSNCLRVPPRPLR